MQSYYGLTLVSFLSIFVACSSAAQDYCLAEDTYPYLFFATKTSYEVVHDKSVHYQKIPDCQPVQLWMLSRHGTRYPTVSKVKQLKDLSTIRDQIIANHEIRKNGELCYEDLENLKNTQLSLQFDNSDMLAKQGLEDMKYLAIRLKSHFPELLSSDYNPSKYIVRYREPGRFYDSAVAFTNALFPNMDVSELVQDPLLMPDDNCSSWEDRANNPKYQSEAMLFQEGQSMKQLIHSVSERLGFQYDLTFEAVLNIYDMCRYHKAIQYTDISPWCAAFSIDELKVMEYYEDLKYYYLSGYGNSMTVKMGCPLVRDLMTNFEKITKNESDYPSAMIHFTNSLTLRAVLTRLGIAADKTAPKHNNFFEMDKRQWRTSLISPFAGNIVAVLYKCTSGEEFRLMFYLNEKMVQYKGCQVGLCNWSYIIDRFSDVIDKRTCNSDFCSDFSSALSLRLNTAILTALSTIALSFYFF